MIFKIKEIFLLIFLILLQSCSGGRVGNFLESSFDNLEKIKKEENTKDVLKNKKVLNMQKKENKKNKNVSIKKEENTKDVLKDKKVSNMQKKQNKKNKNISIKKEENPQDALKDKKVLNQENKLEISNKTNKFKNYPKKRKKELQSYKIIFILKDVDPKDPIKELSTILMNSEVNFEIEKIERFLESTKKNIRSD